MNALSRRRAIRIVAAAAGVGALGAGVRAFSPAAKLARWSGETLGAPAEIALWSHSEAAARATLARIETELARYEKIFSLADPDSAIARLNRDGRLDRAPAELVELLAFGLRLGDVSDGGFDVTVQPVWRVYEAHFWTKANVVADVAARALETACAFVDYRAVAIEGRTVSLARAGMAITLNGVVQGYVTDRIADLLRAEGYERAFVDLGEMRALGRHPEDRPWRVGVTNPLRRAAFDGEIELADGALAVSGGYGTTFEPTGRFHHIFDPSTGASASKLLDVVVTGPRALEADGLSTAIYVAGEAKASRILAAFPGYSARITRPDGSRAAIVA